jgi:hypothetical protein
MHAISWVMDIPWWLCFYIPRCLAKHQSLSTDLHSQGSPWSWSCWQYRMWPGFFSSHETFGTPLITSDHSEHLKDPRGASRRFPKAQAVTAFSKNSTVWPFLCMMIPVSQVVSHASGSRLNILKYIEDTQWCARGQFQTPNAIGVVSWGSTPTWHDAKRVSRLAIWILLRNGNCNHGVSSFKWDSDSDGFGGSV